MDGRGVSCQNSVQPENSERMVGILRLRELIRARSAQDDKSREAEIKREGSEIR